jgi:hypothetical protein
MNREKAAPTAATKGMDSAGMRDLLFLETSSPARLRRP